ncbi:site-2 protease family protein [soil metagenome]
MLHFKFLGFPVTIHWMFWVVSALLGSISVTGSQSPGILILMWMGVVFVSILIHELGHTLFQRKLLHAYPRILLHGMGGLAIPEGGRRATRGQQIVISFMGPLFGLAVGLLTWRYAVHFPPESPMVWSLIRMILWVNIGWSVINLFPVLPLDGGRVMEAVIGGRNPRLPYQVSMVVAVLIAVLAVVMTGRYFLAMWFGFFAYENYQRSKGLATTGFF